jgi:hypothetical protein
MAERGRMRRRRENSRREVVKDVGGGRLAGVKLKKHEGGNVYRSRELGAKAMARWLGPGFAHPEPGQWASEAPYHGPAWLGHFGPGCRGSTALGRAMCITIHYKDKSN